MNLLILGMNESQRFRIGILLDPETIIIILIGTALKLLEDEGL
jgi:hypothetical protein